MRNLCLACAVRARLKFTSQARRDCGTLGFKISQRNLNFASKAEILNPRGLFCDVLLAALGICAQILRAAPQNFKAEAARDKIPPPARLPLKTLALKPCDAQDARSVSQIDRRAAAWGTARAHSVCLTTEFRRGHGADRAHAGAILAECPPVRHVCAAFKRASEELKRTERTAL